MDKFHLFSTMTGSHAYGMQLPTSDIDVRGVYAHDQQTIITGFDYEPQEQKETEDTVHYELKKFFELINSQNPNMLEILWANEKTWLYQTNVFSDIQSQKHNLLTMASSKTFLGYAEMQLTRIKGHYKWINNPQPQDPPKIQDFIEIITGGLNVPPSQDHLARKLRGTVWAIYQVEGSQWINNKGVPYSGEQRPPSTPPDYLVDINYEAYEKAHNNWSQYWSWKENRNKARSALEEKYGYDTKHASHLIRLLKIGKEIMQNGQVNVFREDAKDLLAIRHGQYTYEEILQMAKDLKNEVIQSASKNPLPEKIDPKVLSDLTFQCYSRIWNKDLKVILNRTPQDYLSTVSDNKNFKFKN